MWDLVRPWLFPIACIGCGSPDSALCARCAPSAAERVVTVVADCGVLAAGEYGGLLRSAIVAMKSGERAYLEPLARVLAATLVSNVALVPLPTSHGRRAARGFDQSVELARRAARLRGIAFYDILVKRGGAQRGLDRSARLQAGGRFRLRSGVAFPAAAVVVDDVCTTGATLAGGIATLQAAGIVVTGATVLARTAPGRNPCIAAAVMSHGSPALEQSHESDLERHGRR